MTTKAEWKGKRDARHGQRDEAGEREFNMEDLKRGLNGTMKKREKKKMR